jgi:pimeloyl-ACP methyl ester carboxylesterase
MTTTDVVPYRLEIPQAALDDLRDRLDRTRWPEQIPGLGWSRGVERTYLQELAGYWRDSYDWRAAEAELNAFPQFTTQIDGTRVHFLHVRSARPDATPVILIHGWPGSIVEFLDLIELLTAPADPRDPAFHVVIPSLPGFGLSGPAPEAGWDPGRIAGAFAELMDRLGYDRYLAQGGDFGAVIAPDLGRAAPEHVIGVHVNAATMGFIPFGAVDDDVTATLTDLERARLARLGAYLSDGNGYFQLQATRPDTLGFALTDSPVGQLAWIVEKFKEWTHPASELPEHSVDRDRMLTNVMLYWLTGTGASSAQLYYESMHSGRWPAPSTVPTGVAVFAEDVAIRRFAEPLNHVVHWSDFDEGGHFAAMERPDLLAADLRGFTQTLRAGSEQAQ